MYRGKELYINGEVAPVPANRRLRKLADERSLARAEQGEKMSDEGESALRDWIAEGWVQYAGEKRRLGAASHQRRLKKGRRARALLPFLRWRQPRTLTRPRCPLSHPTYGLPGQTGSA